MTWQRCKKCGRRATSELSQAEKALALNVACSAQTPPSPATVPKQQTAELPGATTPHSETCHLAKGQSS